MGAVISSEIKGSGFGMLLCNLCIGTSNKLPVSSQKEGVGLPCAELYIDIPSLALLTVGALVSGP